MRADKHDSTSSENPPNGAQRWSPFHLAAKDYYDAGYLPIPLPQGKKFPPPKGTPNTIEITLDQIEEWLADKRPRNIGVIVPDGIVVLDIDGTVGKETLIELENKFGTLPPTWKTSRGDPNRYHLWFRTPSGLTWPGKLGPGLDVISRHYRYVVVPPSIHPSGTQYYWINPQGIKRTSYLPTLNKFPGLSHG